VAWAAFVLALFIVQVLWSTGQTLLIDGSSGQLARALAAMQPSLPKSRPRPLRLPYTAPQSPLSRLARRWRNAALSPPARLTLLLVPVLALILSIIAGWQMTLLSLAAAALSLIEWRVARRRNVHYALQAGTLVGLGWLAGHTAFAPLTWTSLTLACCYAIAYQGALYMESPHAFTAETPSLERHVLPWALALLYGGQGAALFLLVGLGRPLGATLAGLLLAPQWLLLAQLAPGAQDTWARYIRRAMPSVCVAMLVAAWTVPA
jgi:hypothetical protein